MADPKPQRELKKKFLFEAGRKLKEKKKSKLINYLQYLQTLQQRLGLKSLLELREFLLEKNLLVQKDHAYLEMLMQEEELARC